MATLSPGAHRAFTSPGVVVAGLLAFLVSQYAAALTIPFINDDFIFLDKTRTAGFLTLWRFEDLSFHW